MKKTAWLALLGFLFVITAACLVPGPTVAPPPVKKEIRTVKPGPNFVWISGHWKWSAGRYVWLTGRWVKKKPGRNWVAGHWTRRGKHWVWVKGHWR